MPLLRRDAWPFVMIRTLFCSVVFIVGCLALRTDQILAHTFLSAFPQWYYPCIDVTKTHFLYLITFISSCVSPCKVSVTFNAAALPESNNFRVDINGHMISSLSRNAVYISNHQIYTDWVFFWFLLYTAGLAGSVYIVLKESLAKVPVLGPGMQTFRFLFLSRKWQKDKINLTNRLLIIDADARGMGPAARVSHMSSANSTAPDIHQWPSGVSKDTHKMLPYSLLIFPEGTVISPHTRERSLKYAESLGKSPFDHLLLPRARGLFLMLRSLRNTVEVVYDTTVGYSGLKAEDYGEEIFTLKAMYLKGMGPHGVNYHIQSYTISDIPLGDDTHVDIDEVSPETFAKFEEWLYEVWSRKDKLMKRFFETGSFKDPEDPQSHTVVADFKLRTKLHIVAPFAVSGTVILLFYLLTKFFFVHYVSLLFHRGAETHEAMATVMQ